MLLFYVIDVETTGLSRNHEITQISIVRCSDRNQLSRNIKALYPERATPEALRITGRTLEDILIGEGREEVVERCNLFFQEDGKTPEFRCVVAHNGSFDRRFCHTLWEEMGHKFPADLWLDTKRLSKQLANKQGIIKPTLTLEASLKLAGVEAKPGKHNAISDTRNTYLLWKKIIEEHAIDYLPLIENKPHIIETEENYESANY